MTNAMKGKKGFVSRPLALRMAEKFIEAGPDECWIWVGGTTTAGYGQIRVNGRHEVAHRVMYEMKVGPIPEGLELDHLCGTKPCVNVRHLEPVTHQENSARGSVRNPYPKRQQTHCRNGHELIPENLRSQGRDGRRRCRICYRVTENNARALLARVRGESEGGEGA